MSLLMFNLAVDEDHVTLAFALNWIRELSKYHDYIDVLTFRKGKYCLPNNVRVWSIGKEKGYPRILLLINFYVQLAKIYRISKPVIVFSHMIPLFSILYSPVRIVTRCRSILWYAHGAKPLSLRLAHSVVDTIVTSTAEGFRLKSSKLRIIGQGIDQDIFSYEERETFLNPIIDIVTVGRLAESKGQVLLVDALYNWKVPEGRDWRLTIIGSGTNEKEKIYADKLFNKVRKLELDYKIRFTGTLPGEDISEIVRGSDLFISLGTTGSLDKAIVEAMATGCPVISSNEAFARIAMENGMADCIILKEYSSIHNKLDYFLSLTSEKRKSIAKRQSDIAINNHSLRGLVVKLNNILKEKKREL